ncbi:hypothetical protein JCGZ_18402 [Jatropha curcas]|uniref:Uncharacterized protein n=1 Tax=Jatropha curcas TaxID=180498 RepID=A0A067KE30_JATCU|nr:hypothetical protein JCGZ_18402 [Jatropha curcas]
MGIYARINWTTLAVWVSRIEEKRALRQFGVSVRLITQGGKLSTSPQPPARNILLPLPPCFRPPGPIGLLSPPPPHLASPASPFLSSFVSSERSVAGGAVTLPRSGSRVAAFSSIFRRHQPIAGQSPRLQHPSNAVAPPLVTGSSRFSEKEEGQRATLHFADR